MGQQTSGAQPGFLPAALISVGLHLVLGALLLLSMGFETEHQTTELELAGADFEPEPLEVVEAIAVDETEIAAQVEAIEARREAERQAEQERIAELESQAEAAEQRRQEAEQEAAAERERLAQEREQEEAQIRQAREEAERLEREREETAERLAAEEQERAELEAERQRLQEEQERLEAERERQEELARERAEREQELEEQLRREQEERSRARQQRQQSEVERYQALIQQTIQQNWITSPSMAGQSCRLQISLARDGFVTNVDILEGDREVCESARAAVLRAGTLPVSDDADVYEELRRISLRVEPEF